MDYNTSSANFIFDGDPQEACIRINITNDDLTEQNETFLVVINTTITSQTVSLNPAYAFVTITDDESKLALSKNQLLVYIVLVPQLALNHGVNFCHLHSTNGNTIYYVMNIRNCTTVFINSWCNVYA